MAPQISKSRSKKSKQRDKEERRKYGRQAIPLTSILIGILMWVSVLALLHIGGSYRYSLLAPGQRAPATIVSEVPFECTDMARTERQRQEAAEEIVPVFTVHYDDLQSAMQALERLFAHLQDIRDDEGESYSRREQEESVADVLAVLGIRLSADEFLEMTDEGSEEELLNAIGDGLRNAWNAGIVSPAERESAFHGLASGDEISLLRRNENDNETVNVGT
jgi:membrane-associated HD superfamily phosphohydrolase